MLWLSDTARKPLYTSVSSAPPRRLLLRRLPGRATLGLFKLDSLEEDVDKVVEREMDGIPHDTPSTPWETDSFRARVCTCDNPLACAIPRFRLRHPSEEDVSSSSRSIELGARKKLFEGRKQNGCRLVNDTSLGSLNIGSRLIDVERIVFEELVGGRAWSWVE